MLYVTEFFSIKLNLFFFSKPLVLEAKEGFVYKYVHALDVEDFDILSHIDDCINFIDDGRKSGGILVHWYI